MNNKKLDMNGLGLIVLLGYQNDARGKLHNIALERAREALSQARQHPQHRLLCTGGFGTNFNQSRHPHGELMQAWLQNQGVEKSRFLPYAPSRNTYEDGKYCSAAIARFNISTIYLVTSDFHIQRGFLWIRLFNPTVSVQCYPSATNTEQANLRQLQNHEQQALKRFYQDFPETPKLATLYPWQSLGLS